MQPFRVPQLKPRGVCWSLRRAWTQRPPSSTGGPAASVPGVPVHLPAGGMAPRAAWLVGGRCLAGSSVRLSLLLPLGHRGSFLLHSNRCPVCVCVWSPAFLIFSAGQLVLLRNRTFCLCLKSGPIVDMEGLPRWRSGKESICPCRRWQETMGSIPGSERSPGAGNGNPL